MVYDGQPALASVENALGPPGASACPDHLSPLLVTPGFASDRNENDIICAKSRPSRRVPFLLIDDTLRSSG